MRALACTQGMTRPQVKIKCKEKNGAFHVIAPMHSYVTNVLVHNLHITIFSRVYSYVTRVYSYVTRKLLVCTRMLLVCSFSHDHLLHD